MPGNLEGLAPLARRLAEYGKKLDIQVLRASVRAGIKPAVAAARQLIPVGTVPHKTYKGRLVQPGFARDNITVTTKARSDGQAVSAAMGVHKEAFYAVQFVDKGTKKMRARHWLVPSFENNLDAIERALADKLRDRVGKLPP